MTTNGAYWALVWGLAPPWASCRQGNFPQLCQQCWLCQQQKVGPATQGLWRFCTASAPQSKGFGAFEQLLLSVYGRVGMAAELGKRSGAFVQPHCTNGYAETSMRELPYWGEISIPGLAPTSWWHCCRGGAKLATPLGWHHCDVWAGPHMTLHWLWAAYRTTSKQLAWLFLRRFCLEACASLMAFLQADPNRAFCSDEKCWKIAGSNTQTHTAQQ